MAELTKVTKEEIEYVLEEELGYFLDRFRETNPDSNTYDLAPVVREFGRFLSAIYSLKEEEPQPIDSQGAEMIVDVVGCFKTGHRPNPWIGSVVADRGWHGIVLSILRGQEKAVPDFYREAAIYFGQEPS